MPCVVCRSLLFEMGGGEPCAVVTELIELALADLGEHFARYRLRSPAMERALEASLRRYGQMSPVVVVRWHERYELVDGFKRLCEFWLADVKGERCVGVQFLTTASAAS
jgi:ParB-like nuclease domain